MALTESKIRDLEPEEERYLCPDGDGLYLAVMPDGMKYWYYATLEGGRERLAPMGRCPDIRLGQARELAHMLRSCEIDEPAPLSRIAEDWYQTRCIPADSKHTLALKRSRLDRFILPEFGGRDIRSISPRELIAAIREIQTERGPNVGSRVRIMMSQIFQHAIALGLCEWDPAAQIGGALIPAPSPGHYAVVTTEDAARDVLRRVQGYAGNPVVRLGLLLLAYTFVRPGEMRLARWPELDLGKNEWRIPAERMKMRREHIVPLSTQAAALFLQLRRTVPHPVHCFALPGRDRPMAKTMFDLAMRSMGYGAGRMTPHGFRGMASTLLNEHGFPPDVIELQLAHAEPDAVRACYNHAELMEKRRRMMQWWGDYLEGMAGEEAGTADGGIM